MMVSYQSAIVRIASEFYFDDAAFSKLGESDQAVQTLSFVYGVRAERVCRDIERAHRILVDGD